MYGQHTQYQHHRLGGLKAMDINKIREILLKYGAYELKILGDFLFSENYNDPIEETIEFVKSSDEDKVKKFKDILYDGDRYDGLFIEGNQYLISSCGDEVAIIDEISEEHGASKAYTRISIDINDFIYLITNSKEVIKCIKASEQP